MATLMSHGPFLGLQSKRQLRQICQFARLDDVEGRIVRWVEQDQRRVSVRRGGDLQHRVAARARDHIDLGHVGRLDGQRSVPSHVHAANDPVPRD